MGENRFLVMTRFVHNEQMCVDAVGRLRGGGDVREAWVHLMRGASTFALLHFTPLPLSLGQGLPSYPCIGHAASYTV